MKRLNNLLATVATLWLTACGSISTGNDIDIFPVETAEGVYIYVDKNGEQAFEGTFVEANLFSDGMAKVEIKENEEWHSYYINQAGERVIDLEKYDSKGATFFSDGIAWIATSDNKAIAINKKGEKLFEIKDVKYVYSFLEGRAAIQSDEDKIGFIDTKGNVCVPPKYSNAGDFHNGRAFILVDGKYGFIDLDGKECINPQFEAVRDFAPDNTAAAKIDGKWGIIDAKGHFIVENKYDYLARDGELYVAKKGKNKGYMWIDTDDTIIAQLPYPAVSEIGDGNIVAFKKSTKRDAKCGYADLQGNVLINPQFDYATTFVNGIAAVDIGEYKLIDKDGLYLECMNAYRIPRQTYKLFGSSGNVLAAYGAESFEYRLLIQELTIPFTEYPVEAPPPPPIENPEGSAVEIKYVPSEVANENTIFEVVEEMPEFLNGSMSGLMKYLSEKIKYPATAKRKGVQGRVVVQFVVNQDGSISDAKVLRGLDPDLDKEAIRVISGMPKWKPGRQGEKKVRVKYTVPVMFRL